MPVVSWLLRAAWLVLPFTVGPAVGAALDPSSAPVRTVATVGLWLAWAAVVLALLVPRPVGLTAVRVAAPAALAASVWAAAEGEADPLALGSTGVATAVAFAAEIGYWMVNGGAYGDERRHLLRPPAAVLLIAAPVTWAVLVAAAVTGPLLLAARQWALGAAATAVGAPLVVVAIRALHALTQRWLVFVPAGIVLKDHLAVVDPVLVRRTEVELLGPAPADSDALDLTARGPGLALEVRLHDTVPLVRVVPGRRGGEPGRTARFLCIPTRPGRVVDDARRRRLPVGPA